MIRVRREPKDIQRRRGSPAARKGGSGHAVSPCALVRVRIPLRERMVLRLPRSARIAFAAVTSSGQVSLSFTAGAGQRRPEWRRLTYLSWLEAMAADSRIRILGRTRIPSAEGWYAICEMLCPVASERRTGDLVDPRGRWRA